MLSCSEEILKKNNKRMVRRPYIPHAERPEKSVVRRNQRERKRMEGLNVAFKDLQNRIPLLKRSEKRIPKEKILRGAAAYIKHLTTMLTTTGEMFIDENAPGLGKWCEKRHSDSDESENFDLSSLESSEETLKFIESLSEVTNCDFSYQREFI
ncbi:unnamed protein product [Dimorphilus gyrociliatus]|uniref:BHLH domain-containing protein n=1 Tax=Dimorphilus gyrociliatus TaxID=2664684 RepID=A0A7I8VCT8_9ANNE|nr:unnamed protein product [Dimorphilus gyrociliatus]